jgi:ElaB/YqjD/DUF883 family membrane-anchored ribosome-binding protein
MTRSDLERSMSATAHKGAEVAGQAKEAIGGVKDAVVAGANSIDLSGLRDEIAKLGHSLSGMAQGQAASARKQVSQSALAAQGSFASVERDVRPRIQKNPWAAVAIAGFAGWLFGKMR